MGSILAWGLDIVRLVQRAESPAVTVVMKGISLLGSGFFYIPILVLAYWCFDRRRGARYIILLLFSTFLNLWLKGLFAQPRPHELDASVSLANETSYGLPSGHAQGSTVFWGKMAYLIPKPWGLILAIVLPLLVGLSRVYLGVHFPTDVFAGWAIGGLLLIMDAFFGKRPESGAQNFGIRLKVIAVAAVALIMNSLDMKDPLIAGAFLGFGLGSIFADRLAPFSTKGSAAKRGLRFLLGIAGVGAIYGSLRILSPAAGSGLYAIFRFLHFGILGAWVGLGAPWAFIKLGLAEKEEPASY